MARKSRRGKNSKVLIENETRKEQVSVGGVYLRISSKDKTDSDSIHNQRSIVDAYLESKPDIEVFKYYIDDGVSSYKDFRPAFEEMVQDIKCGLINTVIVKDISRFGRNYLETGTYLETIFPRLGIRFISVSEDIDSQDKSSKEFEIAIKSLLNHFYAQDISAKVKSIVKQKQILGEYVAARLPYGYEKLLVEDQTTYLLSSEKAKVVKRIFEMALDGESYYKIAGELNYAGIKSPGGNDWTVKAVSRIINNRFYTGVLEMGKTENTLGGMKPFIIKDQQDWINIDNHHALIVDIDTFEKVQRIIEAKKDKQLKTNNKMTRNNRVITTNQASKFDKLLFCGDCGRKMKKQVWGSSIYYVCPKYSETNGACSLKSWRTDRVINALVREIEELIFILENGPDECNTSTSFKDQTFLIQNEIDRLILERDIIYDAFVGSNGYDGKKLRADLDLLDERIKSAENKIDELVNLDSKQRQVSDNINLLKLVVKNLKDPNNTDNDNIPNLECVIKRVRIFDNKLDIEY